MDRLEDADPSVWAPFSKDDVRLVMAATGTADKILAGMRAGETIEEALRSEHTVAVPILNAETGEVTLLMHNDWRIPTARHGQFRAVVEYLRFGGERELSPEILISRAEIAKLRQQMGKV